MKILKKILAWLADPKIWFLIPIMIIAVVATVGATLFMTLESLAEYNIYGIIFIGIMVVTLSYSVFGVVRIYPKAKERILKWSERHPFWNRQFSQYGFTTLLATAGSLFVTVAFAVYNGSIALGIVFSPEIDSTIAIWFGALAAYYIVLVVLRGSILAYHGKRKRAALNGQPETQTLINDGKLYRNCGILLFLLPVCLSFAIMQMVSEGTSFEHSGVMIYVYALYAFFKIITAIYSFIKERHNHLMTIMATKNIKLADAFVSVLALQTAMFREFNDGAMGLNTALMNAVTGAVVCALTVALGVYMIVTANLRVKKLTGAEPSEDNDTENEIEE